MYMIILLDMVCERLEVHHALVYVQTVSDHLASSYCTLWRSHHIVLCGSYAACRQVTHNTMYSIVASGIHVTCGIV